ncbi:Predicted periplasmic lipoprotein [Bordetella ansorpii]|uniref:Predicted periplasmic lipoprotein n=1 Tax=Bordetella ansorpii TaxID=288768 RepID=A0A157RNM1_9BORD|nr:imelysin family protein [Bordetella ansorpii]SAI59563.1 Predicted periplasmic lipoprotein [Bordetella ansorpii]
MSLPLPLRKRLAFAALGCACVAPAVQAAATAESLGQRLSEGYARPAFADFGKAVDRLQASLKDWCAGGEAKGAERVSAAFGETVQAWTGIEFLRFGPLVQGNRYERLAFWPDPRGVVLRQVQEALARKDEALLAPGALATRSVAVQGLPALEFVLYRDGGVLQSRDAPGFAYECRYAQAIAANAGAVAAELVQAWSPQGDFGRQFAAPAPGNDLYRNSQEVAAEAIKALSTGLQFARDIKLLPVLGKTPADARPRRAAFWRSDLTVPSLMAGLDGMGAWAGHLTEALPPDGRWTGQAVRDELNRARQALTDVSKPIEQAAGDEASRQPFTLAALVLKNAKDIADQDFAAAFGVSIGFNALDGD